MTTSVFPQKLRYERGEGFIPLGGSGKNEGIVIARNGQNWRGIVTERLVELVVVIIPFAKVVDHVAKMKHKRRPVRRVGGVKVAGDGIRNFDFRWVLRLRRGAAVSNHVESDALGHVNRIGNVRTVRSPGFGERVEIIGLARSLVEADHLGLE